MRHATDPDHVIAVSTIVSRERSVLKAGLIGIFWGCGHTLTIAIVGSAIVLFGVVIPPRAGLTMEFSVGLMLILLGVLNLTGSMKWLSEKFCPARFKHHSRAEVGAALSADFRVGHDCRHDADYRRPGPAFLFCRPPLRLA